MQKKTWMWIILITVVLCFGIYMNDMDNSVFYLHQDGKTGAGDKRKMDRPNSTDKAKKDLMFKYIQCQEGRDSEVILDWMDEETTEFIQNITISDHPDMSDSLPKGNFSSRISFLLKVRVPQFLRNYKNPCWCELIPDIVSSMYRTKILAGHATYFASLRNFWKKKVGQHRPFRLRCLPYFYIIGQPKCGTTDLFFKLTSHPHIVKPPVKEPHWWTRKRFSVQGEEQEVESLQKYIDLYDMAGECIRTHTTTKKYYPQRHHHYITGEASASTMWDNHQWQYMPENDGLSEPAVLTPHYIRHIQPDVKLIVILRNPTDRLFSDYLYFNRKLKTKSSEDFHQRVVHAMQLMKECLKNRSMRSCAYDDELAKSMLVRLTVGLYDVFLQDWLNVFPKEQIFVLRLEDYSTNNKYYLYKIYDFLGVDTNVNIDVDVMAVRNVRRQLDLRVGDMLNKTRMLLDEFYKPHKENLAMILNDTRYTWEEEDERIS